MPHPADTLMASIWIDIEPADSNQPPIDPRAEQSLTWPVKPIRTVVPLFNQPRYDPRPEPLTLREQVSDVRRRQIEKPFNK